VDNERGEMKVASAPKVDQKKFSNVKEVKLFFIHTQKGAFIHA
jgi:hypothetical protein